MPSVTTSSGGPKWTWSTLGMAGSSMRLLRNRAAPLGRPIPLKSQLFQRKGPPSSAAPSWHIPVIKCVRGPSGKSPMFQSDTIQKYRLARAPFLHRRWVWLPHPTACLPQSSYPFPPINFHDHSIHALSGRAASNWSNSFSSAGRLTQSARSMAS